MYSQQLNKGIAEKLVTITSLASSKGEVYKRFTLMEAAMAVTPDKPAPYAPPSSILDIIRRYRDRGLSFPVNADVLTRIGVPESLVSRTMQALITLDLFNEVGNPTPTLEGIRVAPEAEYKKHLEDWLKSAYADVFSFVDPTTDDDIRIMDAFRSYQPQGQRGRMVTLFQGLCAEAGLAPPKKTAAPRSPMARSPAIGPRTSPNRAVNINIPQRKSIFAKPATGLPPALAGLLESLPAPSVGWTADDREKFMKTFEAVLDFCIPITEPATKENSGQD